MYTRIRNKHWRCACYSLVATVMLILAAIVAVVEGGLHT